MVCASDLIEFNCSSSTHASMFVVFHVVNKKSYFFRYRNWKTYIRMALNSIMIPSIELLAYFETPAGSYDHVFRLSGNLVLGHPGCMEFRPAVYPP